MIPTTDQPTYAVIQDDTVLCVDCVTEVCADLQPVGATLVHAWLAPGPGYTCSRCLASSVLAADER